MRNSDNIGHIVFVTELLLMCIEADTVVALYNNSLSHFVIPDALCNV